MDVAEIFGKEAGADVEYVSHEITANDAAPLLRFTYRVPKLDREMCVSCYINDESPASLTAAAIEAGRAAREWASFKLQKAA